MEVFSFFLFKFFKLPDMQASAAHDESGEVQWLVYGVKGRQFLKSRVVRIGDKCLQARNPERNQDRIKSVKSKPEPEPTQLQRAPRHEPDDEMKSVYNPKVLSIKIMAAPPIKTRQAKRVVAACLRGDYIPGLIYVPDFISEEEEAQIRQQLIDKSELWSLYKATHATKRRNLHFGYDLDYDSQEIYRVSEPELSVIPAEWEWIARRIQQLMQRELGRELQPFNQLLLNEYAPSQGINHHTDKPHCFGPVVAGLSLFSTVVLEFKDKKLKGKRAAAESKDVLLCPRSLFVLTGPARYEWSHSIAKKREHRFYGQSIHRGVRYSFTFRHAFLSTSEVLPKTTYNAVSEAVMER